MDRMLCVGMMTTWKDYLLKKSSSHTWMVYVPLLTREGAVEVWVDGI